ncbi:MAG: protein kinase domain-containing protein [Persicimonas sp.]
MDDQKTVRIDDVTLEAGKLVQGRYKLAGLLGAGGFAKVFEAFDTNIERPVAIKFLDVHRSLSDPAAAKEVLARFEREAKLAARIEHPNVVNIYDYGLLGGGETVPFIVMERLSGQDLAEVLADGGPMSAERALPLFAGCLDALGKAHGEGIVHKDIKPANLFVSNPGERDESLRLVDFGIAHIRSAAEARLTRTGEVLGTPQYFAPEYIADQRVTPALDVYQMGLVLVEMLSGRPVVDLDNSLLCMHAHSTGELEVPVGLVDSALGPVLRKALAYDETERYVDGYAFADALRDVDPSSIPAISAQALVCRLGAERDSNEIVGAQRTADFDRPTHPATRAAAKPINGAPTVGLSEGSGDRTSNKMLLLVAGILGLLLLGAGVGAVALVGGYGESEAADEAAAVEEMDEPAAAEESASDESAKEVTASEASKPAMEEPAEKKAKTPKAKKQETNKPAATKPDRSRRDKASRDRRKKQQESEKRKRRREAEKEKLERKVKKRLEKKAREEAEKGLESLGL